MKITLLGTGTPIPSLKRSSSGYMVEIGKDVILLDHGPGAFTRLMQAGKTARDVTHVFLSHLHFDHCGQNNRFARSTIFVQRAEVEAATAEMYTVPEWAFPPGVDLTVIDGDHQVASDVTIVSTPGHTPGHQSVLIDVGDSTRTIVCCQAAWNTNSFAVATLGDDGWDQTVGATSLERLHALEPDRVLLSHDANEWRPD